MDGVVGSARLVMLKFLFFGVRLIVSADENIPVHVLGRCGFNQSGVGCFIRAAEEEGIFGCLQNIRQILMVKSFGVVFSLYVCVCVQNGFEENKCV